MFVQYKPKGQPDEAQSWDFEPDEVFQDQAEVVEKRYGANWDVFLDGVRAGEAKARKVLLWHLMRLTHHTIRFEDTPRFRMGEVTVEFSSTELRFLADKMALIDRSNLTEDEAADIDRTMARLQAELTDAILRERGDDGTTIHIPGGAEPYDTESPGKADSSS